MKLLSDLIAAFGLMLLIEGALYALIPERMRRLIAIAVLLPLQELRIGGVIAAALGVAVVWAGRTIFGG
jgi:uncharacterized protein YjeT (DUF2065 family)